jgi:hypothetical protein
MYVQMCTLYTTTDDTFPNYGLEYTHNAAIPNMYFVRLISGERRRSKYLAIASTDNRHTTSVPDP